MEWINQFIEMLLPLDRKDSNIEGAFLFKYKFLPKSIFKYREINVNSLKNLTENTVWLSDPSNFNDPYDCCHKFDQELLFQDTARKGLSAFFETNGIKELLGEDAVTAILESKEPFSNLLEALIKNEPEEKREEIKSSINKIVKKIHEDIIRDYSKKISSSFKLCSFSERNDSILMWSHYANYHKGFCIEYDLESLSYHDLITRFLYPVLYSDKIFDATEHIRKASENESFNNLYHVRSALIKATDWAYEKEWRLIFDGGLFEKEQTYPMRKLKALYLGTKISKPDQDTLVKICRYKKIPFFKMKKLIAEYKVVPTSIEDADQLFFQSKP